jgi:hypothetical protein
MPEAGFFFNGDLLFRTCFGSTENMGELKTVLWITRSIGLRQ